MIKMSILADNYSRQRNMLSEHGLSLLLKVDGFQLLFDTGQTNVMLTNAAKKEIDLSRVHAAVLSHGHYDHAGGLPEFCSVNAQAQIFLHPQALCERFNAVDGKPVKDNIGIQWRDEPEQRMILDRAIFSEHPFRLSENIVISGTIPRIAENQATSGRFLKKNEQGGFERDELADEQFLLIRGRKGLYIFTGCNHAGIDNCISYAKKLIPDVKVAGMIGGFHLEHADQDELSAFFAKLEKEELEMIVPLHCTGRKASVELKKQFQDRCLLMSCGEEHYLEI